MWGVSASVPLTRLSSPSSRAKQAKVNGLCYQLCKVPTTNSNCGQASSPSPSPGERAPLKQLCKFSIYVSACHGGHTHQAAGRQAGWQSIRIDSFIDFCHFLVLFAFSASDGTQPARLAGRQSGCASAMLPRQQRPTITDSPWKCNFSCRKCVAPHTHAHTHTHVHLWQCLSNLHIAV